MSLRGLVYEVDATLVGETVTLRFNPARLGKSIEVWSKGRKVGLASQVDVHANCFVKRDSDVRGTLPAAGATPAPTAGLRLRDLVDDSDDDNQGGR